MSICAALLLALAVAGRGGQADTGVVSHNETDTDRPGTTQKTTTTGRPLPSAMYLPQLPVQEPADPCKAGNFSTFLLLFMPMAVMDNSFSYNQFLFSFLHFILCCMCVCHMFNKVLT